MTATAAACPDPSDLSPAIIEAARKEQREWCRAQTPPWPICRTCRAPYHISERHWLYQRSCDACGTARVERNVARIVNAPDGDTVLRAINALERGPIEGKRAPSMAAIKKAAAGRVAAAKASMPIELGTIDFTLSGK
jgi:hypothetical protein